MFGDAGGKVVKLKRGTRWPVGQEVPADWIEEAHRMRAAEGLPRADLAHEAKEFVRHFTGPEARKPVKKDWRYAFVETWCHRDWVKLERSGVPAKAAPARLASDNLKNQRRLQHV